MHKMFEFMEEEFIIPLGSMIIPNKQPEAPLISAFLEFDADINELVLIKEKQKRPKKEKEIDIKQSKFVS